MVNCGILVNRENVTSSPRSALNQNHLSHSQEAGQDSFFSWHLYFSWARISEQSLPSAPLGGPLGEVNFYLMIFRAH